MAKNKPVICPRCDTFLGDLEDLTECPCCKKDLIGEKDA